VGGCRIITTPFRTYTIYSSRVQTLHGADFLVPYRLKYFELHVNTH